MRARINDRLSRASEYPVVLIVAPAGFGKSVALTDFLRSARIEAIRCDVRREDGSLTAFTRGLADALSPIAAGAAAAFPSMHGRIMESPDSTRELCDWFSEHLRGFTGTIVIDDLHYASADPQTTALLVALIEATCDRIKWIIASRTEAALPIATWMAYGRLDVPIDERELRFTSEEAWAAAEEAQYGVDAAEVETLRELTEGWPVALAIALRTRTHAADIRSATSGTREFVYRYLAEQVFAALSERQRAFIMRTSVFSSFDVAIATSLGGTPESLAELKRGLSFLSEIEPGVYRYHELFRDYAESELRRMGKAQWRDALRDAARLLEDKADCLAALALNARAADTDALLRIIARDGIRLFERGHGEALGAALDAIPEDRRGADAAAIGLRAMLDAARGNFDLARRDFARAIERATDDELRYALVHRYALELVRHEHDSDDLLQRFARDENVVARLRVPLLGTLATALALKQKQHEAMETVDAALALLDPTAEDETRARLLQQAAYVYLRERDHEKARTYATLAVELATARNLYEVAVRGLSALYQIAYDDADDPIAALAILDKLLEYARKGGSTQARLFGLMASYWIEAERGSDAALGRIEKELGTVSGALPRQRQEALLPGTALRAAWDGDFQRAYRILCGTEETHAPQERRAYRCAELALYAFAAGLSAEGEAALGDAVRALASSEEMTRRAIASRITIALAEITRGHTAAAHRHLLDAERALAPEMRRLRALANAVRTRYRMQLGHAEAPAFAGALERLRAEQFGGMARLLEALPFTGSTSGGFATLTHAEREILQLLAGGASTKEVAARTGRSPRTVDTHIRSLCQKLGCTGRRAAVAIATAQGWVKTAEQSPAP